MEKLLKYYLSSIFSLVFLGINAQVNCNAVEGEQCKESCELANRAAEYQGFGLSQDAFDKAIEMCPTNDYAYFEKSVPYLKRGDFITWKTLIDKAVELNPQIHLGYRAWCKYQFLRDYEGALEDFNALEKIYPNNIGISNNSDYDLYVAKSFCLDAIGDTQEAIECFESALQRENHYNGLYDYYQLGALYYKINSFDKALENFEKQAKKYDFAENIFYRAKVSKVRNKDYLDLKISALKTYDEGKNLKDAYTHHYNKIYRKQIEEL